MLGRDERLKYSGLFKQAYQKGKSLYSANLKLNFTKTRETHQDKLPYVGFAISKNYSKSAVKRNRLRRQLREIYRLYRLEHGEALKAHGLVVIGPKKSLTAETQLSYQELERELTKLLDKSC
ncbi:MAG: ribonuclease P protein component [Candidatus Melainabacteria bacterium]|nr:ribonuclease P protein component [Candidatus Melainabacteria bacterium]